jgi:hypothetical protein
VTRYEELLLHVVEDTAGDVKELRRDVQQLQVEITKLKVKASAWGALAGVIPGALAVMISLM